MKWSVLFWGLTGSVLLLGVSASQSATPGARVPLTKTVVTNTASATATPSISAGKTTVTNETIVTNVAPVNASAPVYVPDTTHENDPLPDGVIGWNSGIQNTNVPESTDKAHFLVTFTNLTSANIAIMDVHPSCGCTTAQLPPTPWVIPPGGHGEVPITVDLTGKNGTLFKEVKFMTDKGTKQLFFRITIEPAKVVALTDADKERFVMMAKADRQAIFKGDCADCHVKKGESKYGEALYFADCAICHDASPRATMVPDLHNLKVPTNADFWRQWIAHGKPGTLMAAFSQAEGGPLNDLQIASLVAYLNQSIPSKVPSPQ
ncbi:MAG TPA: DUF1573 domain-containing protein [Desulfuromonadaceae bacterium]|nr:DUF1573 domain-containing protein [Desulfuromonadaceae bacterium]